MSESIQPTPPPGFVPPSPPPPPPAPATALTPEVSPGAVPVTGSTDYEHSWGIHLSPAVLDWIPVACLSLILVLTAFPWVGSFPGGTRVYSQYPWQAIFGNFERNTALEELLKEEQTIEAAIGWNFWLMLYLPLLLVTVLLAWLERLVRDPKPETVPGILAWLPTIWHSRLRLLTGLSLLIFLILSVQLWSGLSLEVAIKQVIAEKYVEEIPKATTTPAKQRLSVQMGQELAAKGLQGTTVLSIVVIAHIAAIFIMLLRWWYHFRGAGKPTPWIGVRF